MSIVKILGKIRKHDGSAPRLSPKAVDRLDSILWNQGAYRIGETGILKLEDCNVLIKYGDPTSYQNLPFDKDREFLNYEVFGEEDKARKLFERLDTIFHNACGRFNMRCHEPEETLIR